MVLTGRQIRAARALLRWKAVDLAERAGVGLSTVQRAEADDGPATMIRANLEVVRRALEQGGVEFTNGNAPGVRMRDWRWFLEVFANNQAPPLPPEYFPDCKSLLSRLTELRAKQGEGDCVRVHCPASATDAEYDEVRAAGGMPT